LNDEELFRTGEFPRADGDITKSYTFNRNLFSNGANKIEIRPALGTSDWGVKDVIVSLLPSIPLTLNVTDTNFYGYSETPTRFTGARFKFDLANLDDELQFDVTGWDIDRPDETQVFLNGVSIGYLTQGPAQIPSSYSSAHPIALGNYSKTKNGRLQISQSGK
jgi:hypothetical protein